ncbi:DEAD/DEAH box helicase (plasmid) [Paroceanicella profunda]|uniref:DEAD/DEAH box helicase n=1 Tax=Paroceanicella profunda TaxID=2579971 RepID=A0A5B8FJ29_9RHOB|nr:DEAD/DEAH box helicase [Paroceanicella profunda]QDL94441.1 DEAD/DEAH box helicase [Paroceanicella profunda]
MTEFEGIVPALAAALQKRGYERLTPVQTAVIAPELGTADALVSAQTGSGKTVAFGLALAPQLLGGEARFPRAGAPRAMVIAPTRELALQVCRELEWLYGETGAVLATCVGGMDMRTERRTLERGAHIVVGTPGRLRDHIARGALNLSEIEAVVLDEADEMLDLGFREDLEAILQASPDERRTMMFSATVSRPIAALAKRYQRDAQRITTTAEASQHVDIEYRVLMAAASDKENAILNLLRFYDAENAIVFCNTRAGVTHMTARLGNRGFPVVALSGELSQAERSHALQAMRDGRARVCVATDVAARGIDLPGLELVIHADLPTNREGLLHRSGRTGRAGRKGVSALIVAPSGRKRAERLLASARIDAEWAAPPSAAAILAKDDQRLLGDAALEAAPTGEEAALVAELLARHGAEKVAAAFIRRARSGQSAPEELLDVASASVGAKRKPEAFGESAWFSLSVGRNQNAEPRWLLPMLCEAGGLSRREVGAIRMQAEETHVQIAAGHAEAFLAALGPQRALEKGITVTPIQGEPTDMGPAPAGPRGEKSFRGKPRTGAPMRKGPGGARAGAARSGPPARHRKGNRAD